MLTLLDRYIIRELFSPFFSTLTALCFIIFAKEMLRLIDLLVSKGIGLWALVKIIAYLMPSFLVLTLPIACLIASISTFSRLSFDNELIAMRAAGLSLWRLSAPVFIFSMSVFFATLLLAQWGQPWSNVSLKGLALSVIQDQLNLALDSGVFNEPIPDLTIYVPEPKPTQTVRGVFISDLRDAQKPLVIVAQSFSVLQDERRKQLGLRLFEGAIHQVPPDMQYYHQVEFETYDFWMNVPPPEGMGTTQRKSYEEIIQKLDASDWKDSGNLRRLMEHYKDWGFPVAALLLGLLGFPVGIMSKRSGKGGGFAIGIGIIVGFYLLNIMGEFLVTTYVVHPFVGAWFPNIVILFCTGLLYVKASKN
ncbi:MAG: LPS export ABC transporter permease LptF [Nitrospirales bacterium]|nr:LPS export ABC transporter permease LptF [Nitrospira sp.]MDR4502982.1 LPS export ABC transporter permease LptF [Nitrospirales bacterium]